MKSKKEKRVPPSKSQSAAKPEKKAKPTRVKSTARSVAGAESIRTSSQPGIDDQVKAVLASLKRLADKRVFDDMSARYGIHTRKAFGVSMSNIQKVARPLGRNHELALALWETGWYEA